MTLPAGTVEAFARGELSAKEIRHLVDQHNQGVIDDHVVCAKLDGDANVGDVDYEAQLTALEVPYSGYTPTETAVDRLPHPDPGQKLSEALFSDLVEQVNARVNDEATIAAKLDADAGAGVVFTTYGRAAGQVPHAVRNFVDVDEVSASARTRSNDLLIGTTVGGGTGEPSIFVSRDDGRTWRLLHAFTGDTGVAFIFESEPGVYFAGLNHATQAVLYKSTDYGVSWEAVDTSLFDGYAAFGGGLTTSQGVLYVGGGETDAPVWKSTDGGDTWTLLASLQAVDETEVQVLLEAPDGSIIAGAGGAAQVTIHRSTDEGASWTVEHTQADHSALLDGTISQAGTLILVGTAEGAVANLCFRSVDDGATWTTAATGPTAAAQASIVQGSSGRIYVGGDTGVQVHVSDDDAATFAALNADYFANDTQIGVGVVNRRGQVLVATTNATDGGGVFLIADFEPDPLTALGEEPTGAGPALYPGAGGGVHGDLQDALVEGYNHLAVTWHSLTAELDSDGLAAADYEAQLSQLTVTRRARSGAARTDEVPIGG